METASQDEAELTERLRNGEESALAGLFDRHQQRLWRLIDFRMDPRLRARVEPDDILQEAYLAAHKRIRHFAEEGFQSAFLWLRLIALQTLIDVHRRHIGAQRRDARREVALQGAKFPQSTSASLAIQLVGHETSPSQKAIRNEFTEEVERIIATMDAIDQEILALRHFEELTNGEVARVLGIQEKAASIRYVRALKRLKDLLAEVPGFMDQFQ